MLTTLWAKTSNWRSQLPYGRWARSAPAGAPVIAARWPGAREFRADIPPRSARTTRSGRTSPEINKGRPTLRTRRLYPVLGGQGRFSCAAREHVRRYQRRVYALISRMLHARERFVVADLAQEVFLRTFANLTRFDPEGPAKLSTWIFGLGTRLCVDELRRRWPEDSD